MDLFFVTLLPVNYSTDNFVHIFSSNSNLFLKKISVLFNLVAGAGISASKQSRGQQLVHYEAFILIIITFENESVI